MTDAARSGRDRGGRDRGSVLILALVFMIIGAMMVLPVLSYSMAVFRANNVLSNKTQRVEAVRGGLRATLADPDDLYTTCGLYEDLGDVSINGMSVHNRCEFLDAATALAETEIRYGIITTQVGETAPAYLSGSRYNPSDPSSATGWLADTSLDSVTGKVMLPNLPVYGTSPRSPLGSQMPAGYTQNGYTSCTVYFPGKYNDALTIDSPTVFLDGIYYFTQPIRILGGAEVVVGDINDEGCTMTNDAVFSAEPEPSGSHNVTGSGATWVLGGAARVVFDNTVARDGSPNTEPISFTFNRRYVTADDLGTRPSADVAIITVNGDPEQIGVIPGEGRYLEVYDPADPTVPILHVPEQYVGAVADDPGTSDVNESDTVRDTGDLAFDNGFVASVYTPQPRVPSAPTGVTVQARSQVLTVSWAAPSDDGNSPVVGYTARAWTSNGAEAGSCSTRGAHTCVISGLDPLLDHTVSVEATNQWMTEQSPVPAPNRWTSTVTWKPAGSALAAPPAPARPTVTMHRADPVSDPRTAGIAHVVFTETAPPAGSTPVMGYDIERRQVTDGDGTAVSDPWQSCNGATTTPDIDATVAALDPASLYCDFVGLDPTASYEFRVVARATATSSTTSPAPAPVHPRTSAGTVAAGAPNHAALNTTDPVNPYFGLLAAYVTATWATHADHTPAPAPPPSANLPVPVIAFNLTSPNPAAVATINIGSYVAVPQGRFVLDNPHGYDVRLGGGILAASVSVNDSRSTCAPPAPPSCVPEGADIVPVGLRPVEVQRKFRITSWVDGGRETSVAVVQINQGGAYAVNSWQVQ